MLNIIGTELHKMNDTGRALVAEAVERGRSKCAKLDSLFESAESLEIVELYIELLVSQQITEGKWNSMGIDTLDQMGPVRCYAKLTPCSCGCWRQNVSLQLLLPAFVFYGDKPEHTVIQKPRVADDMKVN